MFKYLGIIQIMQRNIEKKSQILEFCKCWNIVNKLYKNALKISLRSSKIVTQYGFLNKSVIVVIDNSK